MLFWIYTFFVFAHGVAHMVYTSLALGWIPASPGQPDTTSSWLLGSLGAQVIQTAGAAVFTALTLAFAVTAAGITLRQPWAGGWLVASSIASSLVILVFWDGNLENAVSKGLIGLLINLGLLASFYFFRYPTL